MSDLLEKCEEYYGTQDFYELLKIKRDATPKDIQKAYHQLSLLVHPDRVDEPKKAEATEKFKVLGTIHSILQDASKRRLYDDCGQFDEDLVSALNWMDYWRSMFKSISIKDIQDYEKEYVGSEAEVRDVKTAYVSGKGNMNLILKMVPFSNCDSEPRIIEIVRNLVNKGEVEKYDALFNEPARKKNRRRRKYESEKKEFEDSKLTDQDFEREIQLNQARRAREFGDLIAKIEEKHKKSSNTKRKSIADTIQTPPKRQTRSSKNKNT